MRVLRLWLVLILSAAAFGQVAYRKDDVVFDRYGKPMSGARVYVCNQPAVGTPCSNPVTIYRDAGLFELVDQVTSPITTDTYGRYQFYVAGGIYTLQINRSGSWLVMPDQLIGVPSGLIGGGGPPSTLGGIKYADGFAGGTDKVKIDAAISSCGTSKCVVVIPATMADGQYPGPYGDNVTIWDLRAFRSPNLFGTESSTYGYGLLIRRQWKDPMVLNQSKGALGLYCEALAGGINRGGDEPGGWFKANYICGGITGTWRTPGQHAIFGASGNNFSIGDHFGLTTILTDWGGGSASGDESTTGVAVRMYEGEALFTGTVDTVVGNTLNFTNASNIETIGEGRLLINTTPSKIYSTGTVTTVTAQTNNFVFSSASLASVFGTGPKTNLCLSLDNNTVNIGSTPHEVIFPIASITDDNNLTVKWGLPESSGNYPGTTTVGAGGLAVSGTYKIYRCSPITYSGFSYQPVTAGTGSGNFQVADTTIFAPTDTIKLPVWYKHLKGGINIYTSFSGYNGGGLIGLRVEGSGTIRNGISFLGNYKRAIEFANGNIWDYGIMFNRVLGSNVTMIYDTPPLGAINHVRKLFATYDGLGNMVNLGFQQDPTTGGYFFMGRTNTGFTVGNGGVGVNMAPQANRRLAIKFLAGEAFEAYSADGPTAFSFNNAGDVYAAGKITINGVYSTTLHPAVAGVDQGLSITNNGPEEARNGGHVYGNFQRGFEFSDGTISGHGLMFNKTIPTNIPMISDVPNTGTTTELRRFLSTYDGLGAQTYCGFQQSTAGGYWKCSSEFRAPKLGGITDTSVVTNLNADQVDGVHVGPGSAGKGVCWKTATQLGYCSTALDATGNCTCN